jgi:hypothetical protein
VLPLRQGGEGEHQRCGAVVHDEGIFGTGERHEHRFGSGGSPAAGAGLAFDFEIAVAPRRIGGGRDRALGNRRAAEVGVQDHARRVDHGCEPDGDLRGEADRTGEDLVVGDPRGSGVLRPHRAGSSLVEDDGDRPLQQCSAEGRRGSLRGLRSQ